MKQIYLSIITFLVCAVGLVFEHFAIYHPWYLIIPAILLPVSLAIVLIFSKNLWTYIALSLAISLAQFFVWHGALVLLVSLLWFSVLVSLQPMVQKDMSTRVKLDILDVSRRPAKWILFLLAISFSVMFYYRYADTNEMKNIATMPKFEMKVIELSYPQVNDDTTVNQFINILLGNDPSSKVDAQTRLDVLSRVGVSGSYTGTEIVSKDQSFLYQFIGARLQDALGQFDNTLPLVASIIVWQALLLAGYVILPLILAIIFEIFVLMINNKFAEVVSHSTQKEEILL